MNAKNLFYTFIISLTCFFSASTQTGILYYAFYEGQVYFLLEFKKRPLVENPNPENPKDFEWSWGPSEKTDPTSPKSPRSPQSPEIYYKLELKKVSFFLTNNRQSWIQIEIIEEIKNEKFRKTIISRSGLSNYKIESLPKVEIRGSNVRQKRIYYKFVRFLQSSYATFFPKIKECALQEFKEENEKKEEKLFIEEQRKVEQDYKNKELIKSRFDALKLEFTEEYLPLQELNRNATVYSPVA